MHPAGSAPGSPGSPDVPGLAAAGVVPSPGGSRAHRVPAGGSGRSPWLRVGMPFSHLGGNHPVSAPGSSAWLSPQPPVGPEGAVTAHPGAGGQPGRDGRTAGLAACQCVDIWGGHRCKTEEGHCWEGARLEGAGPALRLLRGTGTALLRWRGDSRFLISQAGPAVCARRGGGHPAAGANGAQSAAWFEMGPLPPTAALWGWVPVAVGAPGGAVGAEGFG